MKTKIFSVLRLCAAGLLLLGGMSCSNNDSRTTASTLDVIHSRKSVRNYTDQLVTQEQLLTLAKAGMAAPSARNLQPWHIMAIDDRATLDALADSLPNGKMLYQAPAAMVVCGDMTLAPEGDGHDFWVCDCSAVTENILLAAESMGLGAVWLGIYPVEQRVKTIGGILHLPEHITTLAVISIGYPTGEDQSKDKWKEEKYHVNKW